MLKKLSVLIPVAIFLGYLTMFILSILQLYFPTLLVHVHPLLSSDHPRPSSTLLTPAYSTSRRYNIYLHITDSPWREPRWEDVDDETRKPAWWRENFRLDMDVDRDATLNIPLPYLTLKNGSLGGHVYLAEKGKSYIPNTEEFDPDRLYVRVDLSRYMAKRPDTDRLLLSTQENVSEVDDVDVGVWMTHLAPRVRIQICADTTEYPINLVPSDLFNMLRRSNVINNAYLPWIDMDPTVATAADYLPISKFQANPTLELKFELRQVSLGWYRIVRQFHESFKKLSDPSSGAAFTVPEDEADSFRKSLADTSPGFLLVTFLVALLHALFEYLAFREDVQHWRKLESMQGKSLLTVYLDAATQVVSVLFLYEKRGETSLIILGLSLVSASGVCPS